LRALKGAGYNCVTLSTTDPDQNPAASLAAKLHGILLPFTTPFTASGAIDTEALRANIGRWNDTGIAGYAALGSTGERVNLEEREYLDIIAIARRVVPAHLAFVVGAGQQSTRTTIDEIRRAADAGADALLVITPHYYRAAITQPALLEHYSAVADASPAPVILYSMPALTGIKIEPQTIAQLSTHANIIGVKDSSADIEKFRETVKLTSDAASSPSAEPGRDDFAVLTGNGTVLFEALQAGAAGGILAVGNVVPQVCLEIFSAFNAGEIERASDLQARLKPLAQAVTTRFGIGGLKTALDMAGYVGGHVRAPLRLPDEAARREIAQLLNDAQAARAPRIAPAAA
jgi:4-hydroxy-2-oxoglutarate aldolase